MSAHPNIPERSNCIIDSKFLYDSLVDLVLEEEIKQRRISEKRNIRYIPELAFVYNFETKLHNSLPGQWANPIFTACEYNLAHIQNVDFYLNVGEEEILFEFKMDCHMDKVARDAHKLIPVLSYGQSAYLINIKEIDASLLGSVTKDRTKILNDKISNARANPVVDHFDFVSAADNASSVKTRCANVICMWQLSQN